MVGLGAKQYDSSSRATVAAPSTGRPQSGWQVQSHGRPTPESSRGCRRIEQAGRCHGSSKFGGIFCPTTRESQIQ